MKKHLIFLILLLFTVFQAKAVLKEKNLSQTLSILRAELERSYQEQQQIMAVFENRNKVQHEELIKMMQRSDQIALMLYSQNSDFTFDMAYACQEATEQYRTLRKHHLPYEKLKTRITSEIERYDALIKSLQNLPPRLRANGEPYQIPDSIRKRMAHLAIDSSKISLFVLDTQGVKDRAVCLEYAQILRSNYAKILENITNDQEHYEHVATKVKTLNDYAMERYTSIQKNIFINGETNYFAMLKAWHFHYLMAKKDVSDKYKPFKQKSEWRGPVIIGISIFMLFYILIASLLSYVIVRWCLPKSIRARLGDLGKRPLLTVICGVAIFAISIMVARQYVKQNFILMAINLMITFAWLLAAILTSLIVRLNEKQIKAGIRAYTPFLIMAFIVIMFRIILIPNNLVNLIFPPIMMAFTIWQILILKRRIAKLPNSDKIYSGISLVSMIVTCLASWCGYVLLAVQIMVWWSIQLAAIQTITCFYYLAKRYESRQLMQKISQTKRLRYRNKKELDKLYKSLQPRIGKGEFIAQTWFYDFLYQALLPVISVLSVLFSIYSAARIFEMTSFCRQMFLYTFVDKPGVIQLSLYKICLVFALYFVFKYFNYALRAVYQTFKKGSGDANAPSNITLGNNIISFVVWGVYVVFSLIMLQVPGSGISIVMAGLATGLGFAMKDLLENFVYGLTLMTGRLRVGDYLECDGIQGKVDSINYQSTQIVTLDGCIIAFQNAALFSKNFKNLTRNHGYVMVKIPLSVAYGTDIEKVRGLLIKAMQTLRPKNNAGKFIIDPKQKPLVAFDDFGDSSVDLNIVCWVLVEEKIPFVAKVKELIYNTLNENNIEIPFPQRDIHIKNEQKA